MPLSQQIVDFKNQREYEYLLALKELHEINKQIAQLNAKKRDIEMQLGFEHGRYSAAEHLYEVVVVNEKQR